MYKLLIHFTILREQKDMTGTKRDEINGSSTVERVDDLNREES